jgi:hypothetical protein
LVFNITGEHAMRVFESWELRRILDLKEME